MSTKTYAPQPFTKRDTETLQYGYIFDDEVLPDGVTIDSVSAIVISTAEGTSTTPLTLAGEQENAAAFTDDDGFTVAIGRAVRATTAGGTAGCTYHVEITVTASNGEIYTGVWTVIVEA